MTSKAPASEPRFRPAYMAPMKKFFQIMDEEDTARAAFAQNTEAALVNYGLKDLPTGVKMVGHVDNENSRTLILPPKPPTAPVLATRSSFGERAIEAARAISTIVVLGRTDFMLWVSLTDAYWGNYTPVALAPWDRLMLDAWRQNDVKETLLSDPMTVMARYKLPLPENVDFHVAEQTENIVHMVLPPKGSFAAYSYEDFEELVSGWQWWRTLGVPRFGN